MQGYFGMTGQPRFEYAGAVYHVMARGEGGDEVFVSQDDRKAFSFPPRANPCNQAPHS
jgi:hypothetical protein